MPYKTAWHAPTHLERALVDKLLSVEFDGREGLRKQAATARVRWILGAGAPALAIEPALDIPLAAVIGRIPVEAIGQDADGMLVHFLLHVLDGRLREIEIFREDGEPLHRMPDLTTLTLEVNTA